MSTASSLNAADLHYLAEALHTLDAAAELSNVAAVRGTDVDVRALARRTLAAQRRLIAAVNTCLDDHVPSGMEPRPPTTPHRLHPRPATAQLSSLDGPRLDSSFIESLTAHADRSLRRARTEMVEGLDGRARDIAQQAIHQHVHELEAINRLIPLVTCAHMTSPATVPRA